jgi:hypothetical protein
LGVQVQTNDGVAFATRGDVAYVLYGAAARLHRSRWLFDLTETVAAQQPEGIIVFMIILPTSAPPDAATRRENIVRMRKMATAVKRFVTVPIGDDLHMAVVRTVMRALGVIQGSGRIQKVEKDIEHGIRSVLDAASSRTPTAAEIEGDLRAMYAALGFDFRTHGAVAATA